MVFGWFFGDPCNKLKGLLKKLSIFAAVVIKDLEKEKESKAKVDFEAVKKLIIGLNSRWFESKKSFTKADKSLVEDAGKLIKGINDRIMTVTAIEGIHKLMDVAKKQCRLKEISDVIAATKTDIVAAEKIIGQIKEQEEAEEGKEKAAKPKFPLSPEHHVYTKQFEKKQRKKYKSIAKSIQEKMRRIENDPEDRNVLHKRIRATHRTFSNKWRAEVGNNIRIIYDFDYSTRTITYIDIVTKNEFDSLN